MFSMKLSSNDVKQYDWVKPSPIIFDGTDPKTEELEVFYNQEVTFDDQQWDTSCSIINKVLHELEGRLRRRINSPRNEISMVVGDLIPCGSSSHGLKARYADEFDIKFEICLENASIVGDPEERDSFPPGYTKVMSHDTKNGETKRHLKTSEIKEQLRHVMFSCIDEINHEFNESGCEADVAVRVNLKQSKSPALIMSIYVMNPTLQKLIHPIEILKLDLVPHFKAGRGSGSESTNIKAVLKSPDKPWVERNGDNSVILQDVYWYIESDKAEKQLFHRLIEEIRGKDMGGSDAALTSLLLFKGLRDKYAETRPISPLVKYSNSKVLKTLLMYMILENSDPQHWAMKNIAARFEEFLYFFLNSIEERNLTSIDFCSPRLKKYKPDESFYIENKAINLLQDIPFYDFKEMQGDMIKALENSNLQFLIKGLQASTKKQKLSRED